MKLLVYRIENDFGSCKRLFEHDGFVVIWINDNELYGGNITEPDAEKLWEREMEHYRLVSPEDIGSGINDSY